MAEFEAVSCTKNTKKLKTGEIRTPDLLCTRSCSTSLSTRRPTIGSAPAKARTRFAAAMTLGGTARSIPIASIMSAGWRWLVGVEGMLRPAREAGPAVETRTGTTALRPAAPCRSSSSPTTASRSAWSMLSLPTRSTQSPSHPGDTMGMKMGTLDIASRHRSGMLSTLKSVTGSQNGANRYLSSLLNSMSVICFSGSLSTTLYEM
mmetsp:Transcript_68072/g.215360  ORF Transcript_68072/g.215360 Transcript_68072/m.215360 type:complete len:205 (-) Transcript_68072:97-711(-)